MSKKPKEIEEMLNWQKAEQARIEKERRDYMKKHDMKDFFTPPKGSTTVILEPFIPRAIKGDYGTRYAFRVVVDGEQKDWPVNPKSPVYRDLVNHMDKAPCEFTLVRTGEKQATRYDIVWRDEE